MTAVTNVLRAVAREVGTRPGACAVERDGVDTSYRELWDDAWTCADHLRRHGAGPGDIVALELPRGPELAAAVLGVWLVGAAYVPLDPAAPAQRRGRIVTDAGPVVVLDADGWRAARARSGPVPRTLPEIPADRAAYLIYTSGSTGRPKGVVISHGALANLTEHLVRELGTGTATRMLWLTRFSFDMSVPELYVPLVSGGTSVVAPDRARSDGRALVRAIRDVRPTIVQATPSTWRLAADRIADGDLAGRTVMIGGEPSTAELVAALLAAGARVLHCYGPTETTVWSTTQWITAPPRYPVPVGTAITGTVIACTDPSGRPVAPGEQGEVWIAGAGVALGYHGLPEDTRERFVEHPELGRAYRTGDLGRVREDGNLELLGRADRQIKLRGNRIELGDVEAALTRHAGVGAAAVEVLGPPGDQWLAALVVTDGVGPGALLEHCRAELPAAMVPGAFRTAAALPLTENHKVDHAAVRVLLGAARDGRPASAADLPPDPVAEMMADLWRELLPGRTVGVGADFFLVGGHSLLAAVCLRRVELIWGVQLSLDDFFAHPVLEDLARLVTVRATPAATLEAISNDN